MTTPVLQDYNQSILSSIKNFNYQIDPPKNLYGVLECLFKQTETEKIYGDLGIKLSNFIKNIDMAHPELDAFISNFIGLEAINELEILGEIAAFCRKKRYFSVIPRLNLLLENFSKNKIFLSANSLGDPKETNTHCRFLPKEKLWSIRENKKQQVLHFSKNLFDGSEGKDENIFTAYHHNSDKTLQLKSELERKKKIFETLNCSHMIQEIEDAIKNLESGIITANFGFRKITLSVASNCLKKMAAKNSQSYILPVTYQMSQENINIKNFVDFCDNFKIFNSLYSVFDHYAVLRLDDFDIGVLVAERDTKTFFVGYVL